MDALTGTDGLVEVLDAGERLVRFDLPRFGRARDGDHSKSIDRRSGIGIRPDGGDDSSRPADQLENGWWFRRCLSSRAESENSPEQSVFIWFS